MWIITIIYWLQAFAAPVILFGLIALFINSSGQIAIILLIVGGLAGIVLVEYIRRNIGLDIFFARIYGHNDMDKKSKK